jgi:hypothetical protein
MLAVMVIACVAETRDGKLNRVEHEVSTAGGPWLGYS